MSLCWVLQNINIGHCQWPFLSIIGSYENRLVKIQNGTEGKRGERGIPGERVEKGVRRGRRRKRGERREGRERYKGGRN